MLSVDIANDIMHLKSNKEPRPTGLTKGNAMSAKSKEPLLAIFCTNIFPGLGQIYAGNIKRGIYFIGIYLGLFIILMGVCVYTINPQTSTTIPLILIFSVLLLFWVIFGIFLYVDAYKCAKAFNRDNNFEKKTTFGKVVLLILAIIVYNVFVPSFGPFIKAYVRKNIVQPFKFPSDSMYPTIQKGDRVFADKSIYKKSQPHRGDLIVFIYPADPKKDFLKRLIAFGGEKVEIKDGHIYINDKQVTDPKINNIYYYNRGQYGEEGAPVTVPQGYYYVLGDNSASSYDSRYWGFLPEKNLLGKIYKIYWPIDRSGPVK